MSIEQDITTLPPQKISFFTKIKILLAVITIFAIVLLGTIGVLYFTNARAKTLVDNYIKSYKVKQELKKQSDLKISDERIPKLAAYYLDMNDTDASNKLIQIKKSNKKIYDQLLSSMNVINPEKTSRLKSNIKVIESKSDIIKEEYEAMQLAKMSENDEIAKYYLSLGIKGTIDAIQKELQSTMNYDKIASALSVMDTLTVSKILHYINPMYVDGIRNRFSDEFNKKLDMQTQNYLEFIRKNSSLGELYNKTEEKIAAKELQDTKNFKTDQLAVIFSNMDYLNAAKILNEFEDESKMQEVLTAIKDIEDYGMDFDGSFSTVVSNSIKVLKKYDEDVDTLKKAYEKMQATDLSEIIDKLVTTNPVYKNYKIDNIRNFSITERQMAVEALKRMKPALVGEVLSNLKNNNKVDKAAYLSRELGIPDSTR